MKRSVFAALAGAGLLLLLSSAAIAATPADENNQATSADTEMTASAAPGQMAPAAAAEAGAASPKKWRFSVTPIAFWGLNIEGPVGVLGRTAYTNASFNDIKNALDSAGGAGFTLGRGSWTYTLGGSFMKFEDNDQQSKLLPGITADTIVTLKMGELSAAYLLPFVPGKKAPHVEMTGGARFTQIKAELNLSGAVNTNVQDDLSWTDPFVGMRVTQPLVKNLALVVGGDVAGFGMSGNQSKLTWNFTAGCGYRWPFSGWAMTAFGGYKLNQIDYESDNPKGLQIDQRWEGPVVALTFSF